MTLTVAPGSAASGGSLTDDSIRSAAFVSASPVVTNLLLLDELPVERMVVMVQYEMAARLAAKPSTKDYNVRAQRTYESCGMRDARYRVMEVDYSGALSRAGE